MAEDPKLVSAIFFLRLFIFPSICSPSFSFLRLFHWVIGFNWITAFLLLFASASGGFLILILVSDFRVIYSQSFLLRLWDERDGDPEDTCFRSSRWISVQNRKVWKLYRGYGRLPWYREFKNHCEFSFCFMFCFLSISSIPVQKRPFKNILVIISPFEKKEK